MHIYDHPTNQKRRTIHHSESAQWVKAYCVRRNDELSPYDNNKYSFSSRGLEALHDDMAARANQKAVLELIESCLNRKATCL